MAVFRELWVWVAGIILRNRITILVIIGIITAFMFYKSQQVEMSYEYAPLLPQKDTTIQTYQQFQGIFGEEGRILVLGIQDPNLFKLQKFNDFKNMGDRLLELDGIDDILSVAHAYNIIKNQEEKRFDIQRIFRGNVDSQSHLDSIQNVLFSLPFFDGVLYNKESDTYLMALTLNEKILKSEERNALVKQIVKTSKEFQKKYNIKIRYSGLPYIRVITAQMLKRELNMFIFIALGVTALIMFIFFRSFKIVFFSMLVVGIAVIWAVGTMSILGFKITMLTAMIPPVLIVIGIPNAVFLLNKYHYEYKNHQNKIKALQRVIRKIGNATFLTNLTTASGFATFIITSSRILVEFGIIAAVNIVGVFFLSLLLIPIIFSFLNPPVERHIKHLDNKWIKKLVESLVHISLNYRNTVYIITGAVVVLGFLGIMQIKTTGYMVDDIPEDNRIYKDLMFFEEHFNGLMPLEIMIDTEKPRGALRSSNLQKLERLEYRLSNYNELSKPLSLVDAFKFARQAYYNGGEQFYKLPSSQESNFILSYLNKMKSSGSQQAADAFLDTTSQITRLSYRVKDVGTTRMEELEELITQEIHNVFPPDKFDTDITGASIVYFKGTKYLIKNLFISLSLAIVLIASFMAVMFGSGRMALISLVPNLIPLILTASLMGYFGIPLKPSTILIFSIAFGISVDDTIHFLAKYRQELVDTNWSIRTSVVLAIKETGVSMFYTSIILFFGFSIFSASEFGGTVALGVLVSLTLLVAMFSNLILLPVLLLSLEKRLTRRSFKEPLIQIYNEEEDIDLNLEPPANLNNDEKV